MHPRDFGRKKDLKDLLRRYEGMSQDGTVGFFEETELNRLIDYYEEQHDYVKALHVTGTATEQYSFTSQFYLRKSKILLHLGKGEDAMDFLEKAQIYGSSGVDFHLLKAKALTCLGEHKEALDLLYGYIEWVSKEELAEVYFTIANIYEHQEAYDKMFLALRQSILHDTENEEAFERMWLCVELTKRYKESVLFHQKIIDLTPYSKQAWYNLGQAHFCLQDYENAIEAFEYAFIIDDQFDFAYKDGIEACIELGDYAKALKFTLEAVENIPEDADLYLKLGQIYLHFKKYQKAKQAALTALKIEPNYPEVHFTLGEIYFKEENYVSAIHSYRKAVELDTKREEYVAALGEAYFQIEAYEEANDCFQIATELAPEALEYWIQYASFLMDIDELEEALEVIEVAHSATIGTDLLYCEAACLFKMGRRQEAMLKLALALEESKETLHTLFELHELLETDHEVLQLIEQY